MATTKTAIATKQDHALQQMSDADLIRVLTNSLYPGAKPESVQLVLGYCSASGLDPMQKPVHIVPMWDKNSGGMRDVVMPGIGLYRTQASRTGQYAGTSDPEFGPDTTETIGGVSITFPLWCKVTIYRMIAPGSIAPFPAIARWKENYAVKGGKEKSIAPNSMWERRPYAQLEKCAEALALRKAFPEIGSQPTAEEMEGKAIDPIDVTPESIQQPKPTLMPEAKKETPPKIVEGEIVTTPAPAPTATPSKDAGPTLNATQEKLIATKLTLTGAPAEGLLQHFGIESLKAMPLSLFNDAMKWITNWTPPDAAA